MRTKVVGRKASRTARPFSGESVTTDRRSSVPEAGRPGAGRAARRLDDRGHHRQRCGRSASSPGVCRPPPPPCQKTPCGLAQRAHPPFATAAACRIHGMWIQRLTGGPPQRQWPAPEPSNRLSRLSRCSSSRRNTAFSVDRVKLYSMLETLYL